jgi:RNA polymerase sigma factor (sigma-70 family)
MVLRVCQRILSDHHAAEDAFQATFLVLARKARSIGKQSSLSSWLWQVAYRAALRARRTSTRDALPPLPNEGPPGQRDSEPSELVARRELHLIVLEEIQRLPEKYRVPLILCVLEGHGYGEAADELGRPRGTLSAQVTRGKELIRKRLARRGWAVPSSFVGLWLAETARAQVPLALVPSVLKFAAAGRVSLSCGSETIVALANGVMREMALSKLKWVCAVVVVAAGTGLWGMNFLHSQQPNRVVPPPPAAPGPGTADVAHAFEGKAIRVEGKNLKQRSGAEILLDPEVKTLGSRTFIVGHSTSSGRLWIPVEDVTAIAEYKDLAELRKVWKDLDAGEPK